MPEAGYTMLWEYIPYGRYEAREKEDILLATTSNEWGEGS